MCIAVVCSLLLNAILLCEDLHLLLCVGSFQVVLNAGY